MDVVKLCGGGGNKNYMVRDRTCTQRMYVRLHTGSWQVIMVHAPHVLTRNVEKERTNGTIATKALDRVVPRRSPMKGVPRRSNKTVLL